MNVKKILIFSLAYYPHVGGAEVAVKEITDRLSDIEFHMVTLRFSPTDPVYEKVGNVHVYRIGKGSSTKWAKFTFQFKAAREAALLHAKENFDAVWAMMAHSAGVPAALFKHRYPKVPYILTLQEGDPPKHIERTMLPLWPWFARAFRSATMVTAISTFLGDWARARGFAGPLEIIPNGVDSKKFIGEKIAHERVVLVTASRLVRKNGIDILIRALPLLPPYVQLVVAGTGAEETNLRKLAAELKVQDRVDFKGFVPHSELPALLHTSDIFIRPSRSEGMGNSFVEAMAAGLPVVATQEGGLKDFITNDVAWPVPKDDPRAIAAAVQDILGNPGRTSEVVERAKAMALSRYDWDLVAQAMHDRVFGKVLKNS